MKLIDGLDGNVYMLSQHNQSVSVPARELIELYEAYHRLTKEYMYLNLKFNNLWEKQKDVV